MDLVGIIPQFLSEDNPRPAAEQFDEHYAHGGGWRPMSGWTATHEASDVPGFHSVLHIQYPGDPAYAPVAHIALGDESIWIYPHAWVAIEQADGSVEVARMD